MKPTRRSARKTPKSDPDEPAGVPSPRPFRSDRPDGRPPIRRSQESDRPAGNRRWPTPGQTHSKPWGRGGPQPQGSRPQRPPKRGERDWPRGPGGPPRAGHPQRGPNPQRAQHAQRPTHPQRAPHPQRGPRARGDVRQAQRPGVKEHPQYGTRIPPEELEFMRQNQAQRVPRGGRPGPPGREDRRHDRGRRPDRVGVSRAGEGPPRPVPAIEEPPLRRFRNILEAYRQSATLLAAHQLGLFPVIHQTPRTADDVARRCHASPRGVERLLNALVGLGILHKHGGTYVLPRELAPYVVPGIEGDATGMLDAAADLYGAWGNLARSVREDAPIHRLSSDALLNGDPARVRSYIRAVHTNSREAARRVVEMAPLLPGTTLLDVAGGSGIYAAEYARATPDLKAILFDLPPTIEAAHEILTSEGVEDRVVYRTGDYRTDPFPGPVDAVLLSNLLQTEGEEICRGILAKAREALKPGGTLLVHGIMGDPEHQKPTSIAMHSLVMYALFDHGAAHSAETISSWLAEEGFGVRFTRPLGPPFHTQLILATRLE